MNPPSAFFRFRDIELEADLTPASELVLSQPASANIPAAPLTYAVTRICEELLAMAKAGDMPDNCVVLGWPSTGVPPDTIDTDLAIAAWAKDRLHQTWQRRRGFSAHQLHPLIEAAGATFSAGDLP
jgi:hypothetical protein